MTTAEQMNAVNESLPPVYLVSAQLPGTGSTTIANEVSNLLEQDGGKPDIRFIGLELRKLLGVSNETELAAKLSEIPDPAVFDKAIYDSLPTDRSVVIEGKLATTAGPNFIPRDRQVICIDLESQPLFSVKRILNREGLGVESLFAGEVPDDRILGHLKRVTDRSKHDAEMRSTFGSEDTEQPNVIRNVFDTSKLLSREVAARLIQGETFEGFVPDWEIASLRTVRAKLAQISALLEGDINPSDRDHFRHQYESIGYGIDRLQVVLQKDGIAKVREDLRKSIIDCWFGLMMKRVPRFFQKEGSSDIDTITFDTDSRSWTPEYYKVAEGWPVLSEMLKDKTILDPFAGTGAFLNLLVARGIPSQALYSDMAYEGGKPINGSGYLYSPKLNIAAAQLLFDELPSWYKPNFDIVTGFMTADARSLPLPDNVVDFVCTDPPYGKNCHEGGIGIFFGSIDELLRVSREGVIMMVPIAWLSDINASGKLKVTQLTNDVSRGNSSLPVCYIKVEKD